MRNALSAKKRPNIFSYRGPEQRGTFETRALPVVAKQLLQLSYRPRILDLGWPGEMTVAYYSELQPILHLESLSREEWLVEEPDPEAMPVSIREHLVFPGQASEIDLTVCWDILDYLTESQVQELGVLLADSLRPGAYVVALVTTLMSMPKYPCCYQLAEDMTVSFGSPRSDERPAPRYTPNSISRMLPRFEIERNILLKNGVYELLLRNKG